MQPCLAAGDQPGRLENGYAFEFLRFAQHARIPQHAHRCLAGSPAQRQSGKKEYAQCRHACHRENQPWRQSEKQPARRETGDPPYGQNAQKDPAGKRGSGNNPCIPAEKTPDLASGRPYRPKHADFFRPAAQHAFHRAGYTDTRRQQQTPSHNHPERHLCCRFSHVLKQRIPENGSHFGAADRKHKKRMLCRVAVFFNLRISHQRSISQYPVYLCVADRISRFFRRNQRCRPRHHRIAHRCIS